MTATNDVRDHEEPMGRARWLIVFAAVLGSAVFDLTWIIVGVALPHMQGTFSATPDQIAWVMIAFIVGGTMMTAVSGWASNRFGRKQLFVFALAANTVTTIACGLVDSLGAEVFWRLMQGMFSAPLLALGQAITIDAFPKDKQGLATGIWGSATVGAVVLAPVIGGYLVEEYNWRWVFFAIVPLGLTALACAWAFIPRSAPNPKRRLEWIGLAALLALVGSSQLALSRGERLGWFDDTEIRVELSIAALALLIVVARTLMVRDSFLNRRLFADRNYSVSILFMLLFGGLVTLPMVLMPLMLQQVNGYPALTAGSLMLPRGVGLMLIMVVVGNYMHRLDPRVVLASGFMLAALANLYMSTWSADVNLWAVVWSNLVQGFAAGLTFVPMVSIAIATLSRSLHTEALAFMFLMLNVGKAVGVAAVFALHTRLWQVNYAVLAEHITPLSERFRVQAVPDAWDMETQSGLASLMAEITRQAELIAYLNVFLVIGVIATFTVPLIFLVSKPNRSLP